MTEYRVSRSSTNESHYAQHRSSFFGMNKVVFRTIALLATLLVAGVCHAAPAEWDNLRILRIRAVGNYADATFANSVEIWIANPTPLPARLTCTVNFRIYVNANSKNIVAAAYLALATGKTINAWLDDTTLPIRTGACEASYLDLPG